MLVLQLQKNNIVKKSKLQKLINHLLQEELFRDKPSFVSDVKMPFKIFDLSKEDMDVVDDCTVSIRNPEGDGKEISREKTKISLKDPFLFATQNDLYLDLEKLKSQETKKQNINLPVVVEFPNGVKLIQDGHHRLSYQKIIGNDTALVDLFKIINWADVEPETEELIKNLGPNINEMNTMGSGAVVGFTGPLGMDLGPIHKAFWSGDKPEKKLKENKNKIGALIDNLLLESSIMLEEVVRKPMHIPLPNDLLDIAKLFKMAHKEFYLVGGSVRDALMNKAPKDFDVATNAIPDQVIAILRRNPNYKILEVGKSFGVIKVITPENNEYEIATFRKDLGAGRRPDAVEFTNIEQDVARRDLTMNALFYDIDKQEIVDFVGGIKDIENGVVKTVGDPNERFAEDRLRILRALRFAARLGKNIDPKTSEAIKSDNSLAGVSPERIRDEFLKGIKSAVKPSYFLQMVSEFDLWPQIFPGLSVNTDFRDAKNLPVQLALLLMQNSGDPRKLAKILNGLKYSADEVMQIVFLVEFAKLNVDNAIMLKKQFKKSKLDSKDLIEFAAILGKPDMKLVKSFNDFEFSVSGEELQAQGFKNLQLGQEMERREKENFLKLL